MISSFLFITIDEFCRKQSPLVTQTDVNFSKFDESEEDLFIEYDESCLN